MKRCCQILLLFTAVFIMFLSACGVGDSEEEQSNTAARTPTGYAKGEVQWPYLYWDGKLWEKIPDLKSLPSDAKEVGSVKAVDNFRIPSEEFQATHIENGARIYFCMDYRDGAQGETLLVERLQDPAYEVFIPFVGGAERLLCDPGQIPEGMFQQVSSVPEIK